MKSSKPEAWLQFPNTQKPKKYMTKKKTKKVSITPAITPYPTTQEIVT